ncbi:MAG TPA: ABC transporter substrate-binding protein [Acetobacteraceae bacterium]|jgi:ABC-type branched-subunit amino acid transport system substrate-binding protein|nr:ABC transporter substrate-binding protein [Acetobacteraceae bacterium]
MTFTVSRRAALLGAAALAAPRLVRAQGAKLQLGVLTPLTGAGAFDGPRMLKAMQAVAADVNAAGGVLGKQIELVVEDDETNPEAAVRAAHKLVDVDKVPVIMGTWASAVTMAVAPVCWESKTFLTTVSGADTITQLPHQGYLIRTQPNNFLQATKHAEFIIRQGRKKVFILSIQAPFTVPTQKRLTDVLTPNGVAVVGSLIYDKDKTSYRSEVDQALKASPDLLYLNGYAPDVGVVLRDLYRADYTGAKLTQSYALTEKALQELPKPVTEGVLTVQPSADVNSPAYAAAVKRLGIATPDSYEAQATDWISIVVLTIARAGQATGTAIRDTVRQITNSDGEKVYTAVDGLAAIKAGKKIKYEGASGPCVFTEIGDITDCKFRFNQVANGAFRLVEVM